MTRITIVLLVFHYRLDQLFSLRIGFMAEFCEFFKPVIIGPNTRGFVQLSCSKLIVSQAGNILLLHGLTNDRRQEVNV